MANAQTFSDLARQFEAISPVRASDVGSWYVSASASNDAASSEFKRVAIEAAVAVGYGNTPDAWMRWLDELRREDIELDTDIIVESARSSDGADPDGADQRPSADPVVSTGDILDACRASSRFCRKLAAEFERNEEPAESPVPKANSRKVFVEPLLRDRGWSKVDWAQHAGVDFNTISGYLEGQTSPRANTRKKLADALGLSPGALPL